MAEIELSNEQNAREAWCFDLRTGWMEIDDVVAKWPGTDSLCALAAAGYDTTPRIILNRNCSIGLTVYRRRDYLVRHRPDGPVGTPERDMVVPAYCVEIHIQTPAWTSPFACDGCGMKHCLEHMTKVEDLKLCPVCVEPEPECECTRIDVDLYDASGCPAHGLEVSR